MTLFKLRELLKDIDRICSDCNRCGMCQSVCPVFSLSRHEGDAARGKLALLDGLSREILTRPRKVLERLDRCLLCGACERSCSRQVPLIEIFIRARMAITAYTGLSPFKKMVFRVILTRPGLFEGLMRLSVRFQGFILKKNTGNREGIRETRSLMPFLKHRQVPPFPSRSFRSTLPRDDQKKKTESPRVLFFTGCLIDKLFPHVGEACMTVLEALGVSVHVLSDEACCGIPALASGDGEAFSRLRKHNLDRMDISAYDAIVTACATCTATLTTLWPKIEGDDSGLLGQLAAKTLDITEFIMTRTPIMTMDLKPYQGGKTAITWHDPCHLKSKGQALARKLLSSLPGYEFREMKDAGLCCGSGGSFNLSHYPMSRDLGQKKAFLIHSSGAAQVITACPGCMLQLTDMLARQGSDIRVRHIMELLARSLC